MWGSVCHHVEREASRFIPSSLQMGFLDAVVGRALRLGEQILPGNSDTPVTAGVPSEHGDTRQGEVSPRGQGFRAGDRYPLEGRAPALLRLRRPRPRP